MKARRSFLARRTLLARRWFLARRSFFQDRERPLNLHQAVKQPCSIFKDCQCHLAVEWMLMWSKLGTNLYIRSCWTSLNVVDIPLCGAAITKSYLLGDVHQWVPTHCVFEGAHTTVSREDAHMPPMNSWYRSVNRSIQTWSTKTVRTISPRH